MTLITDNPNEYNAWKSAKNRCHNPKYQHYPNWGGRGITMCDEWRSDFAAFFSHIGVRPTPGVEGPYSLDRIDNDKGYVSGNVRWASKRQQANNTSRTVNTQLVEINGITKPLYQWAIDRGITQGVIRNRYRNGYRGELLIHQGKIPDSQRRPPSYRSRKKPV
jgi:hypothetical protein